MDDDDDDDDDMDETTQPDVNNMDDSNISGDSPTVSKQQMIEATAAIT